MTSATTGTARDAPTGTSGGRCSSYAHHMRDARFTIPTPALLQKAVDMLDAVPMDDRDTKGDLYEYMLGKIATPARTASSAPRATSSSSWWP
jgi:hypothetical protein